MDKTQSSSKSACQLIDNSPQSTADTFEDDPPEVIETTTTAIDGGVLAEDLRYGSLLFADINNILEIFKGWSGDENFAL